jgi:hypothetical protein
VVASRDVARSGDEYHDANVTMLGEYLSRRGKEAQGDALSGARSRSVDAGPCGGELRAARLAPQRNLLLAALDAEDIARLLRIWNSLPCRLERSYATCARLDYAYSRPGSSLLYLANRTSVKSRPHNDGVVGTAVSWGSARRPVVRWYATAQGYRIRDAC